MDLIGRKKGLLVSLVISLFGWVVMAEALAVWIIIVGRFIAGWGASAVSLICKHLVILSLLYAAATTTISNIVEEATLMLLTQRPWVQLLVRPNFVQWNFDANNMYLQCTALNGI